MVIFYGNLSINKLLQGLQYGLNNEEAVRRKKKHQSNRVFLKLYQCESSTLSYFLPYASEIGLILVSPKLAALFICAYNLEILINMPI